MLAAMQSACHAGAARPAAAAAPLQRGCSPRQPSTAALPARLPEARTGRSPVVGRRFLADARRAPAPCRATLDDAELAELVQKMEAQRETPPASRPKLEAALKAIDAINADDPSTVPDPDSGRSMPYRVLYSNWLAAWVQRLDPKASDELLILAKGKNVEGWKLRDIKRDAYPPTSQGVKLWQADRKRWLAERLAGVMKEAGYEADQVSFVTEVMLTRNIPDPRDIRKFDVLGPMGTINFRLLEQASLLQTLKDAEALVFMERNFPQMSDRMTGDDVVAQLKRELGPVSARCVATLLRMPWSQVQMKMISKAVAAPERLRSLMLAAEGTAVASSHPGDWRYRDFQYD